MQLENTYMIKLPCKIGIYVRIPKREDKIFKYV